MADIQVKRATSLTVTETFYLDGAPQDLDSGVPTVVLTAPDGTTTTYNAGSNPAVQGSWTGRTTGQYRLVIAAQPEVTWRDLTWTGTIGGQPQTLEGRVEWVGDLLFTLAGFRQLRVAGGYPFAANAAPLFSDNQILDTRAAVLEEMTSILGFAPVPRFARETHSSVGAGIVLYKPKPLELLSVTVAGTAQTLSNYYLHPAGIVRPVSNYAAGPAIPSGVGNVTVEYAYGWERAKGEASHAAMIWAAKNLNPSGFSSATTISTPDGATYTYERQGGFTGVADLDRWLTRHRAVAGVA